MRLIPQKMALICSNHRKMYYNILIDDRAGLDDAIDMLEYCTYRIQTEQKTDPVQMVPIHAGKRRVNAVHSHPQRRADSYTLVWATVKLLTVVPFFK